MNAKVREIIETCDNELQDIQKRIEESPSLDKGIVYLTRYALIKASGTIELAYRSIVADYFDDSNLKQVPYYINNVVRKGYNSGKYENMAMLLGYFDSDWKKDFKNKVKNLDNKDKVIESSNSLVTNRHNFAHGKDTTATFKDIIQYYEDSKKLVYLLDEVINQ